MNIDYLLTTSDPQAVDDLFAEACRVRDEIYGRRVFIRGLIEISNHCRNNCLYCGIRRDAGCRAAASGERVRRRVRFDIRIR